MQSPKVIRDTKGSVSLQHSLLLVSFGCEFVLAMEGSERERSLHEILGGMWSLADVVTVKTMDGRRFGEYGTQVPVTSDERRDPCSARL
jgi:hypothetical protein